MNKTLTKKSKALSWIFIIIVCETIILTSILNSDLFVYKILVNYLFLIGFAPIILYKIINEKIDIFSPVIVFHGFYIIFFGIPALDLLLSSKHILLRDIKFYERAIFYIILGLHFFQIGYFFRLGEIIGKRKKNYSIDWSVNRIKIVLITISIISIISFFIIIRLSGGVLSYFLNIKNAVVNLTTGTSYLFMAIILLKIPLLIWFCYNLKNNNFPILFFIFSAFVFLLHMSLGERGPFVFLVISLFVCYHYVRKNVSLVFLISIIIFLVTFLTLYLKYRELTGKKEFAKNIELKSSYFTSNMYKHFIVNFDYLERVKDIIKFVPEKVNYQYGNTFFNLLLKPIPSKIWSEKPRSAAVIVTKNLYPRIYINKVTFVPTLIGELYLNFHVIGIISGMLFFGIMMKILFYCLKNSKNNLNFVVFYATIVPYILSQIRGDFAIVNSWIMFHLFFLFLSLKFITIKKDKCENNRVGLSN